MKKRDDIKFKHLNQMADWREKKYREPELRHLFLELTLRCNERCLHCGSNCNEMPPQTDAQTAPAGSGTAAAYPAEISLGKYKEILDEVKEDFDIRRLQLCITGGEPLLRKDFFDIIDEMRANVNAALRPRQGTVRSRSAAPARPARPRSLLLPT